MFEFAKYSVSGSFIGMDVVSESDIQNPPPGWTSVYMDADTVKVVSPYGSRVYVRSNPTNGK